MADAQIADSVALPGGSEPRQVAGEGGAPRPTAVNLKLLLALFLIFVFVVSDIFTNNIVAGFGEKAVRCRSPTPWGVVLQGIFLVIFYILAVYLVENRVL